LLNAFNFNASIFFSSLTSLFLIDHHGWVVFSHQPNMAAAQVLPKTAQGVKEGNKVFGAAVLRPSAPRCSVEI
jgi:hypothetical protein